MGIRWNRAAASDPEPMISMNTTPLIDVMLVLLVMLIITIPVQYQAVTVDTPTRTRQELRPPPVQRLVIDAQQQVRWGDETLPDAVALERRLAEAAQARPQPEIHIEPQSGARYAQVAAVLAAAQRQGLQRIGVIGAGTATATAAGAPATP